MEEKGKTCLVLGIWQFDLKGLPLLSWWLSRKKIFANWNINIIMGILLPLPLSERHSDSEPALLKLGIHRAQSRQPCKKKIFCALVIMEANGPIRRKPHKKCVFFYFPPVRGKSRLIWYFILAQSKIDFPSHVAQSTFQGLLFSKKTSILSQTWFCSNHFFAFDYILTVS